MSKNLKLRIISGTVYFFVLVGFFLLKIFVNKLCFDALILFMGICGSVEMVGAFRDKLHVSQKTVVILFSVLVLAVYAISDFIYTDIFHIEFPDGNPLEATGRNYAPYFMLVTFMAGLAILFGLLVFAHKHVTLESMGYSLISYLYPTVFLIIFVVSNHLEDYSDAAVAFILAIPPCADTLAFTFGKLLGKKLPAKMAPNISPNKTIIGGFGGLVGGAIGGIIVFFVFYGLCKPIDGMHAETYATAAEAFGNISFDWLMMIFFIGIGIVTSAFAQFGDLVESAIKRKVGIKDMGNIMPGHGGVLDRIDSSLYASAIVALIFILRLMLFP